MQISYEGGVDVGPTPPAWYVVSENGVAVIVVVDYHEESNDETDNILLVECRRCLDRSTNKKVGQSEAETISEIGGLPLIPIIEMISWQIRNWERDIKPKAQTGNKLWGYVLNTLDEMKDKIDAHRNSRS